MSHQWAATCNINIKPCSIHFAPLILAEGEMACHPPLSVSLHDPLELSWRNQPSDSDIFKTQVHFSKVPEMSEPPLLLPLSPILSLVDPLLGCWPLYLLSLTACFVVVVLSRLWKHPCSSCCPALWIPGCTDHHLSPACCAVLLFL